MKLTPELKASRLTVACAADLAGMHPTHFRRLCRRGIFPGPKRTQKGRPYFDYELLRIIADVLTSGVGENGEEICFYRRRRLKVGKQASALARHTAHPDGYVKLLAEGLRQLGIPKRDLSAAKLTSCLSALFGPERPDLALAIPAIAQRLLG
jgi:hypothetical protein